MPRKRNLCPLVSTRVSPVLDDATAEALLYGYLLPLHEPYWPTTAALLAAWRQHNATVMLDPTWSQLGRRPIAWYVASHVPLRETNGGPTVRVGGIHVPTPGPWLACEGEWLHDQGKIGDDELLEHVRSGLHSVWCRGECPHQQPQPRRRRQMAHA